MTANSQLNEQAFRQVMEFNDCRRSESGTRRQHHARRRADDGSRRSPGGTCNFRVPFELKRRGVLAAAGQEETRTAVAN